jgi:hypothetical protein
VLIPDWPPLAPTGPDPLAPDIDIYIYIYIYI